MNMAGKSTSLAALVASGFLILLGKNLH